MALIRFNIQLAIPETVYNTIPATKKIIARDAIRELKVLAVKINEGLPNEEDTTRATWHVCYHDENINKPCGEEQEI